MLKQIKDECDLQFLCEMKEWLEKGCNGDFIQFDYLV